MSVPTKGEAFARLTEHLRKAQEEAAVIAHLCNSNDEKLLAKGWLGVSEMLRKIIFEVTQFATKSLH